MRGDWVAVGRSYVQPRTVLTEPLLSLSILGHHFVDLVPERVGVVPMMEVAKLMHDNVVDDGLRGPYGQETQPRSNSLARFRLLPPPIQESPPCRCRWCRSGQCGWECRKAP